MRKDISLQAVTMGLITAFVGWASSFTVVIQGLVGVGATQAQAASGLFAASLAMGAAGVWTSLRSRQPISVAWSTPGAALLATSGAVEGGFAGAVGAFLVCGAMIVAAGYWDRLGKWVAAIPASLANAMLAGVLLGLCLAPVKAVAQMPAYGLAIVVTWAIVARLKRLFAVPAAVVVTLLVIVFGTDGTTGAPVTLWTPPALVMPVFSLSAAIGIGAAAVHRHDGLAEHPRLRGAEGQRLQPAGGAPLPPHGPVQHSRRALRRACGEPVGDHGGAVRRARRAPRSGAPLLGRRRVRGPATWPSRSLQVLRPPSSLPRRPC